MRVWLLHHMTDKYSRTRTLWQALFWRKSLLSCYILSFFFNIDRTFTPYTIQLCWCVEIDLFGWHILSSSQMNWIWHCFVLGPLYWAGDQISNMGRIQGERGRFLNFFVSPTLQDVNAVNPTLQVSTCMHRCLICRCISLCRGSRLFNWQVDVWS